jgi:sugar lactone lactonase YvrE
VSDYGNHRVMKWVVGAKEGIVVAGGHGNGAGLTQLLNPTGVVADQLGTVYVADTGNQRIMRWVKGATQGSVIVGGNGRGEQSNQLNEPMGLSFDRHGNLYVAEYNNRRVQKFNMENIGKTLHIKLETFFTTKFVQKLVCFFARLVIAALLSLNKSYK